METNPAQFTLLALIVAMTAMCFLLGAIVVFGLGAALVGVIGLIMLAYVTAVWGAFYAVAPEAAKYFTVVGMALFMLIGPLPMVLQQQREAARRLQCTSNLAKVGLQSVHVGDWRGIDQPFWKFDEIAQENPTVFRVDSPTLDRIRISNAMADPNAAFESKEFVLSGELASPVYFQP